MTPASHGVATADGTGNLKVIGYMPAADYNSPTLGAESFVVQVSDGNGGTASITVNVTVNRVNDAPVNTVPVSQTVNGTADLVFSSGAGNPISVADTDVAEDQVNGRTLQITLAVSHGQLTLSHVTGLTFTQGGNQTPSMTFKGYESAVNSAMDGLVYRADANYSGSDVLSIFASDLGYTGTGGVMTDTDSVPINIEDTTAPTITNVSSTSPDGSYNAGKAINVQITFSEAVNVTGSPRLTLETGSNDGIAYYGSESGSTTLTFIYTVLVPHETADLDYAGTGALALNGGTIKDAAGNDAALALPVPGEPGSLGANKAIIIDTTAPAAPGAPDLEAASDTGSSSTDNITDVAMPTFIITGVESLSTVRLISSVDNVIGTVTVSDGQSTCSITPATALTQGTHVITATQTDQAGNISVASAGDGAEPLYCRISRCDDASCHRDHLHIGHRAWQYRGPRDSQPDGLRLRLEHDGFADVQAIDDLIHRIDGFSKHDIERLGFGIFRPLVDYDRALIGTFVKRAFETRRPVETAFGHLQRFGANSPFVRKREPGLVSHFASGITSSAGPTAS